MVPVPLAYAPGSVPGARQTNLVLARDQTNSCKIYEHRFSAQPHMFRACACISFELKRDNVSLKRSPQFGQSGVRALGWVLNFLEQF